MTAAPEIPVPTQQTAPPASRQPPLLLILLAATAQGVALWFLIGAAQDAAWPAAHPGVYAGLLTLAVFLVPTLYALAEWTHRWHAWAAFGGAAVVLLVVGFHSGAALQPPNGRVPGGPPLEVTHFLTTFMLMFHAVPFAQCALAEGRWRWHYARLFEYAWRNALRLALAGLFAGVTWLLLWTAAQLFEMLGIRFLMVVLFDEGRFFWLPLALAFGAGVYFAENSERLMLAARSLVLALLKWLAAAAALILVLFSVALLIKTPELFASDTRVISATWLLWLAALNIYLYNAGFQDGSDAQPYPRLLARLLRYATPLLLLISVLAAYALLVRVVAYGLTVARVWGLLVAGVTVLYAAGYVLAARRAAPWMAGMARVNTIVAAVLVATLLLMLTPPLSPQRLTAASLEVRLLAAGANVDINKLRMLKNDTGRYGETSLRRLASSENTAVDASLRSAAASAFKSESGDIELSRAPETVALTVFPSGAVIDEPLRAAVARWWRVRDYPDACRSQEPCPALVIDINADGVNEAVLFGPNNWAVFRLTDGRWAIEGLTSYPCIGMSDCDGRRVVERLRAGDYELVKPQTIQLRVGEWRFDMKQR
jgi:hypothetical protein